MESLAGRWGFRMARTGRRGIGKLWAQFGKTRSLELRNRLVEHYLPMADRIARRYCAQLAPQADRDALAGEARVGLIQAVESFDPARGTSFSTFAYWRIRGAILDAQRNSDHLSRRHRRAVKRGDTEAPRQVELEPDALVGRTSYPVDAIVSQEAAEWRLHGLPIKEQTVLYLHYWHGLTHAELAKIFGVNQPRLTAIFQRALAMLRARKRLETDKG